MRQAPRPNGYRTAWCGALGVMRVDETVRVAGWVDARRDHGGLIFIDLRDRSGIVQLVFHPETSGEAFALAHSFRSEDVVSAAGVVVKREEGKVNPLLATGEIEISVTSAELLADAETPPFPLDAGANVDEALRLRHRSLDLRRAPMQRAMVLRHQVTATMREVLNGRDFLDIETPNLTRSTPEGARDYLVPARVAPGSFYALPQSPQLFKQLLMIAGFERYYQIARCFRDEDTRADRQPEFTQLDVELAFVTQDDVIEMMEAVMGEVFARTGYPVAPPPWPRMPYAETMRRFGSDRPDLRFGLELVDLGDVLAASEFKVFSGALSSGGVVRALNAGTREIPRSELDSLTEYVKGYGAKGLVWGFVQDDGTLRSPIAKFLSDSEIAGVIGALNASPGDVVFAVADSSSVASDALGALRLELARRFGLVGDDTAHQMLWVVDFPAFLWNAGEHRWDAVHHPFTRPIGDLDDPGSLLSSAYDLVLDGTEIGGGSIRIHELQVQRRVFEILGISSEEAESRFGFLLDALKYGAPPHGGIAMGIDRIVQQIGGYDSIRDVIAFPKTATGADPLTGAPAGVDAAQLRELGLRVVV
jgi:aspartyl-tRNA synthetase